MAFGLLASRQDLFCPREQTDLPTQSQALWDLPLPASGPGFAEQAVCALQAVRQLLEKEGERALLAGLWENLDLPAMGPCWRGDLVGGGILLGRGRCWRGKLAGWGTLLEGYLAGGGPCWSGDLTGWGTLLEGEA